MDTAKKGCLVNVMMFVVGAFAATGLTTALALIAFLPLTSTVGSDPGTPGVWVKKSEALVGAPGYEVLLGSTEDYGHVVGIPRGWGHTPQVVRHPDRVELRFDNGGLISVPASTYSGGR